MTGGAAEPLLRVAGLSVAIVGEATPRPVLDDISFTLDSGETLCLVGESGCGKTTAGKGILQLIKPTGGSVRFDGQDLVGLGSRRMRPLRRDLQIIFQDPFASMNPRMLVGDIVEEGMLAKSFEAEFGIEWE